MNNYHIDVLHGPACSSDLTFLHFDSPVHRVYACYKYYRYFKPCMVICIHLWTSLHFSSMKTSLLAEKLKEFPFHSKAKLLIDITVQHLLTHTLRAPKSTHTHYEHQTIFRNATTNLSSRICPKSMMYHNGLRHLKNKPNTVQWDERECE